jgi:H+/Cl- antiporter ClcA
MLEIWIVFGSAISAFGLGYMITQFDVIIPILFGRQWRADDMWWRQIIGAAISFFLALFLQDPEVY